MAVRSRGRKQQTIEDLRGRAILELGQSLDGLGDSLRIVVQVRVEGDNQLSERSLWVAINRDDAVDPFDALPTQRLGVSPNGAALPGGSPQRARQFAP